VRLWKSSALPPEWFERPVSLEQNNTQVENDVKAIVNSVIKNGDLALISFTKQFEGAHLKTKDLRVKSSEIRDAYKKVGKEQIEALKFIKSKVKTFEQLVLKKATFKISNEGIAVQNVLRPIDSVGCYVPGGQATYPSTLIMTAVPAKTAGVPRVVVCSPPSAQGKVNPLILVAADLCEVDEIYKVGGAQAVAALAYGTETIKPVKKIVGPGSIYVTSAKILVSKRVAIDMPAGPSEVLVLADETANPQFVALDMLSQAEHGADSVAGLITPSESLAEAVKNWLGKVIANAERREIVAKSLEKFGFIITCRDMVEAVDLANTFSSEHIEIIAKSPEKIVEKITSAGLILIGPYRPVALSDYASGTNHVLPTGGFGHVFSGLSGLDFVKRVSIVKSSKDGLQKMRNCVKVMTEAENLPNHFSAFQARLRK
jgi:histidinol dehydrogenase